MAQVINTNIMSLMAQNNLNKSQSALSTSIQRLSTGYRINSAKDDAAGQGIANRFTAQIRGLTQAARNANDGLSLTQTIEGGVNQINDNLQRMRELTVQALNGTNTDADKKSIYQEVKDRASEIDRISKQVNFNGKYVLGKHTSEPFSFQVGANDSQIITFTPVSMKADELGVATTDDTTGISVGATDAKWLDKFVFQFGKNDDNGNIVLGSDSVAASTDPWGVDAANNPNPHTILGDLDQIITKVDDYRATLGAAQNRFEATVSELNGRINNLTASRSRIEDADYATEVSNMTRAQILQQAGTSVLSQANQVPQTVLSLLQS